MDEAAEVAEVANEERKPHSKARGAGFIGKLILAVRREETIGARGLMKKWPRYMRIDLDLLR